MFQNWDHLSCRGRGRLGRGALDPGLGKGRGEAFQCLLKEFRIGLSVLRVRRGSM